MGNILLSLKDVNFCFFLSADVLYIHRILYITNNFYLVGQIQYMIKKGTGKLAYGGSEVRMPSRQLEWEINACLKGQYLPFFVG